MFVDILGTRGLVEAVHVLVTMAETSPVFPLARIRCPLLGPDLVSRVSIGCIGMGMSRKMNRSSEASGWSTEDRRARESHFHRAPRGDLDEVGRPDSVPSWPLRGRPDRWLRRF
ncbi:hypothetical protein MASR1M66_12930 [Aminivibrio sp.]